MALVFYLLDGGVPAVGVGVGVYLRGALTSIRLPRRRAHSVHARVCWSQSVNNTLR